MKTTEQTRRELFEASMREALLIEGYDFISIPCVMGVGSDGQYSSVRIRGAWQGFNAALDAVVIELPDSHCEAQDHYMLACEKAVESTGLGLKIR